jgi:dTDP-glucose 4,6-dehydratase
MSKTYLVTGGCGFIGSNFIHHILSVEDDANIVNLDKLTYAGNLKNHAHLESNPYYHFVKGDICNQELVEHLFEKFNPDYLINFAAETHVDRSIGKPDDFIKTDIIGTFSLLEAARKNALKCFIQISTDEVYGSISEGSSLETDPLMPRNPYSASKAGADRLAYSYFTTYDIPVIITRASNNFGKYQYPEKLIPLFVTNAIDDLPLPLYGDGKNIRDWLYVEDHCNAIYFLLNNGKKGEVYNIGGGNEMQNIEITNLILRSLNKPDKLLRYVKDRQGHDRRYSLNCEKIAQLGWVPIEDFKPALTKTIEWYLSNENWWRIIKSGEFKDYYKAQYQEL